MFKNIIREITPLDQNDCFTIISRKKEAFDFPIHSHEEMELNLILHGEGAQRIIGDHVDIIGDVELVLISSNLPHGWFTHQCQSRDIREVTIQFQKDLFPESFLRKSQLLHIKKLLECARRGVLFPRKCIEHIAPRITALDKKNGFDSILELFSILHMLSTCRDFRMLSDGSFTKETYTYNSRRLERVFGYMNSHFKKDITLSEVSGIANMPESSFSRFIKVRTGQTFTESLTEIRLGHVSRMLIASTHSVAEIAFYCGFNNLSNFNRVFREKKGCTPSAFRRNYTGHCVFV
jgi:AraC-like DNA-binding protein